MNTKLLLASVLAATHTMLDKEFLCGTLDMVDNHYKNKPKPRKWHGQTKEHRDWNAAVDARRAAKKANKETSQ